MKKGLVFLFVFSLVATATAAGRATRVTLTQGHPTLIAGLDIPVAVQDQAIRTYLTGDFLPTYLPAARQVEPTLVRRFIDGNRSIFRYEWRYRGIPVEGGRTVVTLSGDRIDRIVNALRPVTVDTTERVAAADAARIASSVRNGGTIDTTVPRHWAEKLIIRRYGKWHLVWKVRLTPTSLADGRFAYIDAHDGAFLGGGNDTRYAVPTDMAKVFETNPIRDKKAIEVELPWIDPDDGKLTALKDENGVRAIVAANCPDEGKKTVISGYGELSICSPTQVADKFENGSFIYEDWGSAVDFKFSVDDVYPEVAMYYHASKIYKFLRELEVDGFHYLAGHNADSAKPSPLIVIANFQFPAQAGGLAPMDNAFFSPNQPGFNDIFFADFPYQGDILVFGQGGDTDFACDGDVVYHEFGHAVENGTSQLTPMAYADEYGFSNVPIGMNEGIADTFSFIMSEDPCLAEYVSEGIAAMAGYEKIGDHYCMRYADNDHRVNEDYTGESHHDGLPLVGANWDIYQLMKDAGHDRTVFARLILRTLLSLADPQSTAKDYANILLAEVAADSALAPLADDIHAVFEEKLFFETIRARDITRPVQYIMSGGTGNTYGAPATSFVADVQGDEMKIAPAYVQFYIDMPACKDTLTVSGKGISMSQQGGSDPYYQLFVRKGKPVAYDIENYPVPVAVDQVLDPVDQMYEIKKMEPGARYYLHFVNLGGEGLVAYITTLASRTSTAPCDENPDAVVVTDEDETPDDDTVVTPDTAAKKSDGGCSLVLI